MSLTTDLAALAGHEVVLYGSVARGDQTPRSDVDVAVLSRSRDRLRSMAVWDEVLGQAPDHYDVRVFELMPIHVRAAIARHHEVVFGDPVDISAYFYRDLKDWQDVRHRYEAPLPPRERLRLLTAHSRPRP